MSTNWDVEIDTGDGIIEFWFEASNNKTVGELTDEALAIAHDCVDGAKIYLKPRPK